ncbi:SDR family oxidoreductase [Leptospira interrogans]|uniref:3-dehydrosphinganine reductase n=1 Tax=Leptospira interrogans serovar Lora str. TE 1992 TaxID=1193028 RepID=M3EZA3_LEPIR|nr:SDR family oxidoreductase [Leptospira interrogans]AKH78012.1 short-chain dehydrogenase [Leptospira interrogans serovar Bratislava]EMF43151.1 KR domain protein [Leptospira interrogans serovar Lora str. TE 1992]EMN06945.1 KR domain protein [Leptospira interrogans serovar Muenchen str. Brem 129]KLO77128.1 KR domain protein [Leptospira interrogans serovar Muenchen]
MKSNHLRFEGRNVFIVGGSAGIGKGLALEFAKQGANVVIAARNKKALETTVAELRTIGFKNAIFDFVVADVSNVLQIQKVAKKVLKILRGLDLLICNSGYAKVGKVEDLSESDFRTLMDVNFFGHVNFVRAFHAHFLKQGFGDIVLVSSMLATFSIYGYGAYSASKFAIIGFAQSLRQEMMFHGVRVKVFLPPTTDTPGLEKENRDKPELVKEMEMGSAINSVHSVGKVVNSFMNWFPKKKFLGYATWDSWLQYFLARHFPEWTLRIADAELRAAQKRLEQKNNY